MAAVIKEIRNDSIAQELSLQPGDILLSINGHPINDLIDYRYYSQDDDLEMEVLKGEQELWSFSIEKDYDEDMGLVFEDLVFDRIKGCKNRCIFCFIDQLPSQMRRTLYVKDDDYRHSFMFGNYITLTNLSENDWSKIINMRLSPLYVSVHCMQGDLRAFILKNPQARNIKADLIRLKEAGIQVHTQIVLIPGVNDGEILQESINELAALYPAVISIGIVPVGLTGHRQNLPPLKSLTPELAREIISFDGAFQESFRRQWGLGLVYLADEFYLKAGIPLPEEEYYDDFCQLENGIGLSRIFLDEFAQLEPTLPRSVSPREAYLLTGVSAQPILQRIADRLNRIKGLSVSVIAVENHFFGGGVTVTGLLTGSDIIRTLGKAYAGKRVIIPEVMFRDGQDVLLDDISLLQLKNESQADIQLVDGSARDLLAKIFMD